MNPSTTCPTREQLFESGSGSVSALQADVLEQHLLECASCNAVTAEVMERDPLVQLALEAGWPPVPVDEDTERLAHRIAAAVETRLDAAMDTFVSRSVQRGTELDLSFLKPAVSSDELGRLGNFRVLRLLGSGGMGAVFEAEDLRLRRRLALKVMLPGIATDSAMTERFLREARSAAAVHHRNVVTIFEVEQSGTVPYLVMELLQGESLEDRLKRDSMLPMSDVLRIGSEMAAGLAAAHAKGLIHRDIKPANVWLERGAANGEGPARDENENRTESGLEEFNGGTHHAERDGYIESVKLLDFGLARSVEENSELTGSGIVIGTPSYMAPEQANGDSVDARTDLFSLGVVLYRMTTGNLPFPGRTTMEILKSLATVTPVAPISINSNMSKALSDLIEQLLSKAASSRPRSAAVVVRQLAEIERTGGLTDDSPGPDPATGNNRDRARPVKAIAVFFGGLSLIALLSIIVIKIKTKDGKEIEVAVTVPVEVESVTTTVTDQTDKQSSLTAVVTDVAAIATLAAFDPANIQASERFDWQPKELVAVIGEHRLRHWDRVMQIRFHSSGDFFVTCPGRGAAGLWMTNTLESQADALKEGGSAAGFEFSSDGKWMASANQIYTVDATDAARPQIKLAHTLSSDDNQFGGNDVAIHDDRWLIMAADEPGVLLVWDVAAHPARVIKKLKFEFPITTLTLSRDGHRLAARDGDAIRVWEIDWSNAGDPTFTLRDQPIPGNVAAMNSDGSLIAAGGEGIAKIDLWDVSQTPFTLRQQIEGGRQFAFSSDGDLLAVAAGLGFQLYAREDAGWVKRHSLSEGMGAVISLAWSPNQSTVVAGDQFGGIHVWDLSAEPPQRKNSTPPASNVVHAAISPDGRWVITSGADYMTTAWKLDGTAPSRREWDAFGGGGLSSFSHDSQMVQFYGGPWNMNQNPPASVSDPIPESSRFSAVEPCLISYQGDRLFCRDWELTKRGRFVLSNERDLWRSPVPVTSNDALETLQFGANRFATRQDDHTVCVWSLSSPEKPLYELKHDLKFGNSSSPLTLSPDGTVLLVFSQERSVVWDLEETPPREYPLHLDALTTNTFFREDNKLLFVADGSGVGIYDWANNRELRRLKYPGSVRQIVRHPDGLHIATVNGNGTVYILRLPELSVVQATP